MSAFPSLDLGIANGWILLAAYGIGFVLALVPFSRDGKARLFADPKSSLHGPKKLALRLGQVLALAFVALTFFVPITRTVVPFWAGTCIYVLGYSTVLSALRDFRLARAGQPATGGPYRVSRNPQWVGLFLVLLGTAITSAAWVMIAIVLVIGCIYHLQILEEEKACCILYGEAYLNYAHRVPRYFLWF
jgi:protein-S-isoprenylcysteine O-methyltransferase Ste14